MDLADVDVTDACDTWSVQRIDDLPQHLLPSTFPVTLSYSCQILSLVSDVSEVPYGRLDDPSFIHSSFSMDKDKPKVVSSQFSAYFRYLALPEMIDWCASCSLESGSFFSNTVKYGELDLSGQLGNDPRRSFFYKFLVKVLQIFNFLNSITYIKHEQILIFFSIRT